MHKLLIALTLTAASTLAFAHGCPGHMRAVDAKLAENPTLSAEDLAKVKQLRADGETAHKDGRHGESMRLLAEARKLLKI